MINRLQKPGSLPSVEPFFPRLDLVVRPFVPWEDPIINYQIFLVISQVPRSVFWIDPYISNRNGSSGFTSPRDHL